MEHFHPGERVFADGREAHVAFTDAQGTVYVHTLSGTVPARHVTHADLGAPRQLEGGSFALGDVANVTVNALFGMKMLLEPVSTRTLGMPVPRRPTSLPPYFARHLRSAAA